MGETNGNFFEDFHPGLTLKHAIPRTVTEGDQSLYVALTGDRRPLHCASTFAQRLGFRRETVNDLLVFHMVFGKSVGDISLNAVANLGYAELVFLKSVYPGDTLRAESKVLGVKENSSGKTGIVWVETTGLNQDDEAVLRYVRWVMVHKRDASSAAPVASPPKTKSVLGVDELVVPAGFKAPVGELYETGGARFFEDYEAGEHLAHAGGMTIEDADHMSATRLYQNTAKVHFDGHGMSESRFGRRLMYGGHVMSVCHALAFAGLENAVGIAGFNGGTHSAPTFGGDTLYARTEILETAEAPGRSDVGFVRCRLNGYKNIDPASPPPRRVMVGEKERWHENVVLDLDYWMTVLRRNEA